MYDFGTVLFCFAARSRQSCRQVTFRELPNQNFVGKVERVVPRFSDQTAPDLLAIVSFNNEKGLVEAVDTNTEGKQTVQLQENGGWRTVVVETGISDGRFIEISSGVKEGDTVLLTP